MSQCDDIFKLLKKQGKRGATALLLWKKTGSLRASARIDDLRKRGHIIVCEIRKVKGKNVHVYELVAGV
jgi:hypothetical protein